MADWPHLWTTGRCSVASRSRVQSLPSQKPNKSTSALFLLIVLVDDFEIAKRATLLFSRENDFFELDDRNNLSTNMKQETNPASRFIGEAVLDSLEKQVCQLHNFLEEKEQHERYCK
ncbi:hypothetical protein SADUNF_Sadunf01G0152200 [Salix dunnii]|uniref:Uncharacterized protein n=1 Tax=Salix dunnii TaxID=1413687 RepID=A0A835TMY3_9ROSI|nr:hypothetical protein SADUNF_Sadunf01G0152200 [Salix dunnii]